MGNDILLYKLYSVECTSFNFWNHLCGCEFQLIKFKKFKNCAHEIIKFFNCFVFTSEFKRLNASSNIKDRREPANSRRLLP